MGGRVAGRRECIYGPTLGDCDLRDDVGRCAKSVQADSPRLARHSIRPVADEPGTQERCRLRVAVRLGKTERIARIRDGIFCVATVDVASSEARVRAQILAATQAVLASAARPPEPWNPDAIADRQSAHCLACALD